MKKAVFFNPLKTGMQILLLLAIFCFNLGSVNNVHAGASATTPECGQLLADAKAQFMATLSPDGSIPASPETRAAAQEYIRVSKLCYDQVETQNSTNAAQTATPTFIDDGGVLLGNQSTADFVATGGKWGSSTVTYSFMGNGLGLSGEPGSAAFGTSVAITSLPGFQVCFLKEIQNAFAAWQAVSNIRFVQVTDNPVAFGAAGATGDIRIGAHAFDGPSGTLAHAYFPAQNAGSGTGDIHFDKAENWTCNTSGIDIGIVALHEIGHSLGLNHQASTTPAVMNPIYNTGITSLQQDDINGALAIYGAAQLSAPPVNDNFANAKTINSLTYSDLSLDTTGATEAGTDPTSIGPCDNGKTLDQGWGSVWYKYKPLVNESIAVETQGSSYDTVVSIWTGSEGSLSLVKCDDDDLVGYTSQLSFVGTGNTTYYFEVTQYKCSINPPCVGGASNKTGGTLQFHVNITNTAVFVGPAQRGSYYLNSKNTVIDYYPGVAEGPVKVVSSTGNNVFTSQRAFYGNSFNELTGFPANQLTTDYWFTYYDDIYMATWLMIGNPDPVNSAHVEVYIGGGTTPIDTFDLAPGQSVLPRYGIAAGPVRVKSTNGVKIFTSQRAAYGDSFNELMGYPANQLTTDYWFTYYDDIYMATWLMVGNPDPVNSAHVQVYIGGGTTPIDTFDLAPGQSVLPRYGIAAGPVRVKSTNGVKIFTSQRAAYGSSFNELMGYPANQLTTDYWFTYYDDATASSGFSDWLMIGNPDPVNSAHVEVYIGSGSTPFTYDLAHGQSVLPRLGIVGGPVRVVSTNGVKIFTSQRVAYGNSFNELMGFPANKLTTDYWFTYYDDIYMSTWVLIGAP